MPSIFGKIPSDKKASIIIKKKSGDVTLSCHFNPDTYTVNRSVSWQFQPIIGGNVPTAEFKGGSNSTTSLKLLFDTTGEEAVTDVRDHTKKLWDATKIDQDAKNTTTNQGEPPHVVFIWGRSWSFEAVITSLSEEFVLFSEEGVPLRSNVNLSLTQVKDDTSFGRQNPTSGATPGRVHTVREGDRLDLISAQYYKKATHWRYIAEQNGIDNPRQLKPGQRLVIRPLP